MATNNHAHIKDLEELKAKVSQLESRLRALIDTHEYGFSVLMNLYERVIWLEQEKEKKRQNEENL